MRSFLFSIVGVFGALFGVSLPFSYAIIPTIGNWITHFLSPISLKIASLIIDEPSQELILNSDSSGLYGQAIFLLLLSILLAYIISKQKVSRISKIQATLFKINTFILSLFLLKYGLDKLFLHQFYSPEPNTLFTPLGKLSKDLAFWSIMGSSSSYNYFMGLIEIVPAFLLFFKRTRTFGAFVSIGIMINVFALNIGFDITVKLLSAYLIMLSCYIFSKGSAAYFTLFFNSETKSTTEKVIETPNLKTTKVKQLINWGVVLIILIEVFTPYFGKLGFNGHQAQKKVFLRGSYDVVLPIQSQLTNDNSIEKIHLHKDQYLIFEDNKGSFKSYSAHISRKDSSIHFTGINLSMKYLEKLDTSIFQWKEENKLIKLKCKKIDINTLPLLQDDIHLTVEGMLE